MVDLRLAYREFECLLFVWESSRDPVSLIKNSQLVAAPVMASVPLTGFREKSFSTAVRAHLWWDQLRCRSHRVCALEPVVLRGWRSCWCDFVAKLRSFVVLPIYSKCRLAHWGSKHLGRVSIIAFCFSQRDDNFYNDKSFGLGVVNLLKKNI